MKLDDRTQGFSPLLYTFGMFHNEVFVFNIIEDIPQNVSGKRHLGDLLSLGFFSVDN